MKKLIIVIAVISFILSGCSHDHSENEVIEEEGLEPLVFTLYTEKTELFVEFEPMIVGNECKFAAHFTELGTLFKPFTEGKIILTVEVNGKSVSVTSTEPQVPGIFRLRLTPETAGNAKITFDINTINFSDKIVIDNVTIYPDMETAEAEYKTEEGSGSEINYLKEQAWKVEFANEPVIRKSFNDIIKTSGQILSAPGDEMIVTANAGGIIQFIQKNNMTGAAVSQGSELFVISGGDLAQENIDAGYREARSNYERAKADFERAKELVADKIISEKEYLKYLNEYENAGTVFDFISKNYSIDGQSVSSPMSGFIKNVLVTDGQYVTPGTQLARISKNKNLVLQVNVSQKYFERLSTISSANFKFSGNDETYNTENLNGRIISYGKSLSENSPFIPVIFEFDNIGNMIPGSVAEVFLKSHSIPDALVIPESALIEELGKFYVYIQTGGESFEKREVNLGGSDGINVLVKDGISEGERVVTKGAYQIKLSTATGTLPEHGHEH